MSEQSNSFKSELPVEELSTDQSKQLKNLGVVYIRNSDKPEMNKIVNFNIDEEFEKWEKALHKNQILRGYRSIYVNRDNLMKFEDYETNEIPLTTTGSGFSSWGLYRSKQNLIYIYHYSVSFSESKDNSEEQSNYTGFDNPKLSYINFVEKSLDDFKHEVTIS